MSQTPAPPRTRRPSGGGARGFTLIEMMVVVAIIGIVAALISSVASTPYTANPRSVADQVVATMNLAKMRAVSSRHWHRVEVTGPAATPANTVTLWAFSEAGMRVPDDSTCNPGPPASFCWEMIEQVTLPNSIVIRGASAAVSIAAGATVTVDTALDFDLLFRPDGSSTGGTVFLDSKTGTQPYRLVVYPSTGSSYARANW